MAETFLQRVALGLDASASGYDTSVSTNLTIAVDAVRRGLVVFPCGLDKRPIVAGGFKSASRDMAVVRQWWRRWPDALPGIPTSDVWVLDLDVPTECAIAALERASRIPFSFIRRNCGFIVRTGGGGLHLYFRRAPGVAIRNTAGDIAPGVDTRGHISDGTALGYVIAAGAVNGEKRYEIISGGWGTIRPAPLQLLPMVVFSSTERREIAASPSLVHTLSNSPPNAWREIFDGHQAEQRSRLARYRAVLSEKDAVPLRRQALDDLSVAAQRLAHLTDGRHAAAFRFGCAMAKYKNAGALTEAEIVVAFADAWTICGGAAKRGLVHGLGQIRAGLAKGANDLPPLIARKYRR